MKYRYQFHPYEYILGENEKFYSDMERKGWRLVKRGVNLSKFTPAEPARTRYRIEIVPSGFIEDGCTIPEEQKAVYEDCGWEYVTGMGLLHIFRAPEDSGAPEFYAEPSEQAKAVETLKKQRMWSWIPIAGLFLWNLFFIRFPVSNIGESLSLWYRSLIEQTGAVLLYLLSVLWLLYLSLRRAWYLNRTCRQLKNGVPLDHNPQDRHLAHKITSGALLALMGICALLTAAQLLGTDSVDPPLEADGPYLLLSDLGWEEMERVEYLGKESSLTETRSLLGEYWDVYEIAGKKSSQVWLFQDVYRLRSPKMAARMAGALRNTTTFGNDAEDCYAYVMDGLSAWVYHDMEIVVLSGNMAGKITYMGSAWGPEDPGLLLSALYDRWQEYD